MTQSAILIVDSAQAAAPIIHVINSFATVFAHYPIRVLRKDDSRAKPAIIQYAQKFKIRELPALITADSNVRIGITAISSFLPQFAKNLQQISQARSQPQQRDSVPRTSAGEMDVEEYQRQQMFKDQPAHPRAPQRTPPGKHVASRARSSDDVDSEDEGESSANRAQRIQAAAQARMAQLQRYYDQSCSDPSCESAPHPAQSSRAAQAPATRAPPARAPPPVIRPANARTAESVEDEWERRLVEDA